MTANGAFDRGLANRTQVLGADYVARSLAPKSQFEQDFQRFVTEYCWGTVWDRPGLPREIRSLLNVAMLTALGRNDELKLHIRGAFNNGVTRSEMEEALFQVAVYCGIPAALEGLRTLRSAISEMDAAAEEEGN